MPFHRVGAVRSVSRNLARLLELETYRLMCLMTIPKAKRLIEEMDIVSAATVTVLEEKQALDDKKENGRLIDVGGSGKRRANAKRQRGDLQRLMRLQTRCEQLGVELRGRLRECEAYGNVVERRLSGMQIAGVANCKSLPNFVRKRLDPALRTYSIATRRLDETTATVSRSASLCRTEVDIDIQALNENLLVLGTVVSISSLLISVLSLAERA